MDTTGTRPAEIGPRGLIYRIRRSPEIVVALAAAVALVVVVILVLMGKGSQGRFSEIPEASLFYPGSVVLRHGGHESTDESNAERWTELGSNASMAEIQAYFELQFARGGWIGGGGSSNTASMAERQVCAWHNERVVFRLGFWISSEWRAQHPKDPAFATVYDLDVIDRINNRPPRPPCGRLPDQGLGTG